jgi:hypothetical protein
MFVAWQKYFAALIVCSLGLIEVIAVLHVAAIMYLEVIIPMRWLAGNTHKLVHRK